MNRKELWELAFELTIGVELSSSPEASGGLAGRIGSLRWPFVSRRLTVVISSGARIDAQRPLTSIPARLRPVQTPTLRRGWDSRSA